MLATPVRQPLAAPADERAARSVLRDQIARLESELASLFCDGAVSARAGSHARGPRLLSLGELERVRDELADRTTAARRMLEERGREQESNRRLLEEMLLEPARHPGVRLTAADIGEPSCKAWEAQPRLGLLGMLMRWWRVHVSSGCPLPRAHRWLATQPGVCARRRARDGRPRGRSGPLRPRP
jgi:hypothetical protein